MKQSRGPSIRQRIMNIEMLTLVLGVAFSIVLILIIPPFQSPDEPAHFYRAYSLSNGILLTTLKGEHSGSYLPSSLERVVNASHYYWLGLAPEHKTSVQATMKLLQIPLAPQKKIFIPFSNTALYSPIPYIPAIIAIWVGRLFHVPVLILLYLSRLATALTAFVLLYLAIRKTPVFKHVFAIISLMPMTILITGALSADSITIALALFFVAHILFVRSQQDDQIDKMDLIAITLSAVAIALCKSVYIALLPLILLIPTSSLGRKKNYLSYLAMTGGSVGIIGGGWNYLANKIYAPGGDFLAGVIHPAQQVTYMKHHLFFILRLFLNDMHASERNLQSLIGVFGWQATPLPYYIIYGTFAFLILAACLDHVAKVQIEKLQKVIIGASMLGGVFLIYIVIYITWNPVGAHFISGIQGRYFIPLLLPMLLLIYNNNISIRRPQRFTLFIFMWLCFALIITTTTILFRYYPLPKLFI